MMLGSVELRARDEIGKSALTSVTACIGQSRRHLIAQHAASARCLRDARRRGFVDTQRRHQCLVCRELIFLVAALCARQQHVDDCFARAVGVRAPGVERCWVLSFGRRRCLEVGAPKPLGTIGTLDVRTSLRLSSEVIAGQATQASRALVHAPSVWTTPSRSAKSTSEAVICWLAESDAQKNRDSRTSGREENSVRWSRINSRTPGWTPMAKHAPFENK